MSRLRLAVASVKAVRGDEMGPLERRLRLAINPISTGLTARWLGIGRREVPASARAQLCPDQP
jgi:hypothetical protein